MNSATPTLSNGSTYFDCLGLPVDFNVDATLLDTHYRQRQAAALDQAQQARFNQAYETLSRADRRAAYLLQLAGQGQGLDQSIGDLDFLQHALELRMSLEEADSPVAFEALKQEVSEWHEALVREFGRDYQAQDWPEARDTARKLAFMQKLSEDLRRQHDKLDDPDDLDDF